MNCFAIPLFILAALGADQRLNPSARLESGGEVSSAEVSFDGRT